MPPSQSKPLGPVGSKVDGCACWHRAHACTTCGAPRYAAPNWNALELVQHVTRGTDACTGAVGVQFDFWSNSFYAAVPEASDAGPIPPWSLGNFAGVMAPLRTAPKIQAECCGLWRDLGLPCQVGKAQRLVVQ